MGGEVKIESKSGIGTKITFILKFSIPTEKEIQNFKIKKKLKKEKRKTKITLKKKLKIPLKILVVEDNLINQKILIYVLKKINPNFNIFYANDGYEAIKIVENKFKKEKFIFDIIFTGLFFIFFIFFKLKIKI
jgi:PleD family two-component response regulator